MKLTSVKYFLTTITFLILLFFSVVLIVNFNVNKVEKIDTEKTHIFYEGHVLKKEYTPAYYYFSYYLPPKYYLSYVVNINEKDYLITTEVSYEIYSVYNLEDTVRFCSKCKTLSEYCI